MKTQHSNTNIFEVQFNSNTRMHEVRDTETGQMVEFYPEKDKHLAEASVAEKNRDCPEWAEDKGWTNTLRRLQELAECEYTALRWHEGRSYGNGGRGDYAGKPYGCGSC